MEYQSITPSEKIEINHLPELGFDLDGLKFTLLNMQDSRFPIDLVAPALALINDDIKLTKGETAKVVAQFLSYFQELQPKVWRKLRTMDDSVAYIMGIIEQWVGRSAIDPKASSSTES